MVASASNRVLLDTHALVWYAENSTRLPEATKQLVADEQTLVYVSVVSFWELATLTNLGRLVLSPDLATWIAEIRTSSFQVLAIEDHHLVTYAALPQTKDHRDPFDRLLIAQALSDDLTLVSRDGKFAAYPALKLRWE